MARRVAVAILSVAFVLGLLTGCRQTRDQYSCDDWGSQSLGAFSSGGFSRPAPPAPRPAAPVFKAPAPVYKAPAPALKAPAVKSPVQPAPKPGLPPAPRVYHKGYYQQQQTYSPQGYPTGLHQVWVPPYYSGGYTNGSTCR